jgi:hypothetical protein
MFGSFFWRGLAIKDDSKVPFIGDTESDQFAKK